MSCRDVKLRLERHETDAACARHLRDCTACCRYAERLGAVRALLREHHARVEPGIGFAGRVAARLPDRHADSLAMGWAAARLLPVMLALLLVVGWMAWSPSETTQDPTPTDVLAWVLDPSGVDS